MLTDRENRTRAGGQELALIGLILSLALLLRLFRLGLSSLWLDESVSVTVAKSPIWQILTSARLDSQPPLYDLLLHFWLAAGGSEFTLRFPSLAFGILSVALLYRFARSHFGPRVALLSAFLLAISPLHVWYSQEARSYALGTLFGLASFHFFSQVQSKGGKTSWLAYLGVTLAGLYANYGMMMVVAGQNLYLLILFLRRRNRELALPWVLGQGLLLLGFSPWLTHIPDSLQEAVKDHQTVASMQQLIGKLGPDLAGPPLSGFLLAFFGIALAAIAAIGYGLARRRRSLLGNRFVLLTLVLGAYSAVTLLSALPQGASVKRQLLILLPLLLLAVSLGSNRLKLGSTRLAIAAILIAAPALSANYFFNQKEQWREAAQFVQARGREGDLVLLHAGWTKDAFRLYYTGALPYRGTPLEGLSKELTKEVSANERVWLVLSNDRYRDPKGEVRGWFDRCYKTELTSDFAFIAVRLYEVARKECSYGIPSRK